MATFSIQEALSFGWKTTLKNFWFIFGALVTLYAVSMAISLVQGLVREMAGINVLVFIASIVVPMIIQIGLIAIFLKIARGEKPEFTELFTTLKPFWSYLGATLVFTIAIMAGLVLFIIPGLIAMTAFMFYTYLIIEKGLGPIEALGRSAQMTKGSRMALFGFILLTVLLNIVGVLFFFVGLFVTVPMTAFATIYIYRIFEREVQDVSASASSVTA